MRVIPEQGITEVEADGRRGRVTPCTNPIVTPMCNAMFAFKGGTRSSFRRPPREEVRHGLNEAFRAILKEHGAAGRRVPDDSRAQLPLTQRADAACDVVIATGGMAMVKSAYSSGKPSFGVGAGNVQCIFDRGIDVRDAAKKAVDGRVFDNGIICSGEQTIIAPKDTFDEVIAAFKENGAY